MIRMQTDRHPKIRWCLSSKSPVLAMWIETFVGLFRHRLAKWQFRLAARTHKDSIPLIDSRGRLERALLGLVKAMLAQHMRWLAAAHFRLKHIGESSRIELFQRIALALARPVFEAHNLCFKFAYILGRVQLLLLDRRQRILGVEDVLLKVDFDVIDGCLRVGSVHALREVISRLEAAKARSDWCMLGA